MQDSIHQYWLEYGEGVQAIVRKGERELTCMRARTHKVRERGGGGEGGGLWASPSFSPGFLWVTVGGTHQLPQMLHRGLRPLVALKGTSICDLQIRIKSGKPIDSVELRIAPQIAANATCPAQALARLSQMIQI